MSDSDDETLATFGDPLEPLDEENLPRKKAVAVEDQCVYDAQGRRRFHGAFTGGFSAGYFNTVGTRDGWKPQQFKSSRGQKAKTFEQQPEDFMDEEDVSIFGIAPKGIRANSDYEQHGQKGVKRGRSELVNNLSYNPVLKELLKPVKETVGIALLKKMGWKPGQGVGSRLTKKEKIKTKRRNEKMKVYSCSLPPDKDINIESESDSSDDETSNITFAPDDYEPIRSKAKDNYFGIGYSGLSRQNVLFSQTSTPHMPEYHSNNRSLPIHGQAFGVGAFEADDEDIYAKDDMSQYDLVLGPERKNKSRWSQDNNTNIKENNTIESFVRAKNTFCYGKIFPLPKLPEGFQPVHVTRKSRFYPPISRGVDNEKRKHLNAEERSRILNDTSPINAVIQGPVSSKALSSGVSSSLTSNTMIATVNIAKDTSDKATTRKSTSWMDKLNAKTFISGGTTGKEQSSGGLLNKLQNSSELDSVKLVTSEKLTTLFLSDPDKQKRFEQFVIFFKAGEKHKFESVQPLSMSEWERNKEFIEFEQAIRIVERTTVDTVNVPQMKEEKKENLLNQKEEAAEMEMFGKLTREIIEWRPASIVCKRFNIPEPKNSCAQPEVGKKVAKFSLFDSINLDTSSRFLKATDTILTEIKQEEENIRSTVPENVSTNISTPIPETSSSSKDFDNGTLEILSEKEKNFKASYEKIFGRIVQDTPSTKSTNFEVVSTEKSEIEEIKQIEITISPHKQSQEAMKILKNSTEEKKDLYRAIFLSSSDESETEENIDSEIVKSVLIGEPSNETNVARNRSPPRGIFAKLDLDDLIAKKRPINQKEKDVVSEDEEKNLVVKKSLEPVKSQNQENNDVDSILQTSMPPDVYGPVLPSRLIKIENTPVTGGSILECSKPIFKSVVVPKVAEDVRGKWVERHKVRKVKKEKKKHKHKEHKSSKNKRKSKKDKH